jgi:hypothetical protein
MLRNEGHFLRVPSKLAASELLWPVVKSPQIQLHLLSEERNSESTYFCMPDLSWLLIALE